MGYGPLHAVRFYESEAALCRIVAAFVREGLALGHPALVIATPEHSDGILTELQAREMDVAGLVASGNLVVLDAQKTMDSFMVNGMPDADRFRETATAALDMVHNPGRATIRAYGEMVDLMWRQGRDTAAIQLEMLWNRLARSYQFSLLCSYAMGNFYKESDSLLIGALRP